MFWTISEFQRQTIKKYEGLHTHSLDINTSDNEESGGVLGFGDLPKMIGILDQWAQEEDHHQDESVEDRDIECMEVYANRLPKLVRRQKEDGIGNDFAVWTEQRTVKSDDDRGKDTDEDHRNDTLLNHL